MKWLCWIFGHRNVFEPWRQGVKGRFLPAEKPHWLRAHACCRCGEIDFWQVSRAPGKPLDVS